MLAPWTQLTPIEKGAITGLMKPMIRIYQNIQFAAESIQTGPGVRKKALKTA